MKFFPSIFFFLFINLKIIKREPLGKTLDRKYSYPNETQKEVFKYGVPTKFSLQKPLEKY